MTSFEIATQAGKTVYLIDGQAIPEPERDHMGEAQGPKPHEVFWEAIESLSEEDQARVRASLQAKLNERKP